MVEIKNIDFEDGINEIFQIVELDGLEVVHDIQKPDGWEQIDCVLKINNEFFNVEDFILGKTQKIKFLEYYDKPTFDIIKKVYDKYGGDGKIGFRWKVEKDGEIYDILKDGYQLNLNLYDLNYEKEGRAIELEIKRRESNNKLLTREDISVDLFSEKDLDGNEVEQMQTIDFYYKERNRIQSNFYFLTAGQNNRVDKKADYFWIFTRSENYEIGDNTNTNAGIYWVNSFSIAPNNTIIPNTIPINYGDFIFTKSNIENLSVWFRNFHTIAKTPFKLFARKKNGGTIEKEFEVASSEPYSLDGENWHSIKLVNHNTQIGQLLENRSIDVVMRTDNGTQTEWRNLDWQSSIEFKSEMAIPLRKAKMIRLGDAIGRIAKLYSGLSIQSNILTPGGAYYDTAVATGMFLRGFSDRYMKKSLKTSLKQLLYDSAAPLMALGFDVLDEKIRVESVDWFFKDVMNADFSDKKFIESETNITHDLKSTYNELLFGSKKYSTENKGDLKNFNTKLQASTPIESAKNKFDKTTDFILDDYKIQNMILEKSTASKNTDEDLAAIDLVKVDNTIDHGVLSNCIHSEENGKLLLTCFETPFDTIPLSVGMSVTIDSGLNNGTWTIVNIDKAKMTLNKTSGIEQGKSDTPISYVVSGIIKNRTNEDFYKLDGTSNIETSSNIRHNPKFHLARWFGYFGGCFSKKDASNEIKVTDYTNNGDVIVERRNDKMVNELGGLVQLNSNESLERLRAYKSPYFSCELIETTITGVTFFEFINFYLNWRYSDESRGFIRIDTPDGIKDVFVFGDVSYDRGLMELQIIGRIKNKSFISTPDIEVIPPQTQVISINEVYRSEKCERTQVEIEIKGNEAVSLDMDFISNPTGGSALIRNENNEYIVSFDTEGKKNISIEVKDKTNLIIEVLSSSNYGGRVYSCSKNYHNEFNDSDYFSTKLSININGSISKTFIISNETEKYLI